MGSYFFQRRQIYNLLLRYTSIPNLLSQTTPTTFTKFMPTCLFNGSLPRSGPLSLSLSLSLSHSEDLSFSLRAVPFSAVVKISNNTSSSNNIEDPEQLLLQFQRFLPASTESCQFSSLSTKFVNQNYINRCCFVLIPSTTATSFRLR